MKGIEIDSTETKLTAFADNICMTTFVRDKISLEHVFEILQQFEKASGLRVNEEKTEAYWLGSSHNCMLNLSITKVNEL